MDLTTQMLDTSIIKKVLTSSSFNLERTIDEQLIKLRTDRIDKAYIFISSGSSGQIGGATEIRQTVVDYLKERNIDCCVKDVGSIGLCSSEPLMYVQLPGKCRLAFEKMDVAKAIDVLDGVFSNVVPKESVIGQFKNPNHEAWDKVPYMESLPFFAQQHRIILENCGKIDPESLDAYVAVGGYKALATCLNNYTPNQVRDFVISSGLRGRGGGGYLTGQKWKDAQQTESETTYLICNADESDPGAFMDRSLIEGDPHKLVEGIAIASYALRTTQAFVYIRSNYSLAINRLRKAILECKEKGLLGDNILGSGFNLNIDLKIGAGAFVCGEETALISSIEGKRGTPSPRPPYPTERGLYGKPTVVNNVETLANLSFIINNGPDSFKSIGTKSSSGTKVFSLSGKVNRIGLVEIPMGTSFREIIFDIAGGIPNHLDIKAVQIGGPSGSLIAGNQLDTPIDFKSLNDIGAIMGSGGMVVIDEKSCMVDITKFFIEFLHQASCGKCIPCREGTRQMYEILHNISVRSQNEENHNTLSRFKGVMQLESLAKVIEDTSLCGLGKTAPKPLLSAIKEFREEFEEHIFDRKCRAGICKGLKSYSIDVNSCIGCTLCLKKCPEGAIIGTAKSPHFIVKDKCTGCGVCYDSCKFNAIHYS
ncbi:MAG: 4Fe-4S binding protein [Bacteroidales bacterium]|nr:4Fe-4S binding protein [Bacteroidales bacterium]